MKTFIIISMIMISSLAYGQTNQLFVDSNLTTITSALSSIYYMKTPDTVLGNHTEKELQTYVCGQLGELSAYAFTLQGNGLNGRLHRHPNSTAFLDLAVDLVNEVSDTRNKNCNRDNFNFGEIKSLSERSATKLKNIEVILKIKK